LFNNYGPTENTVVTTNYRLAEERSGTIPIGKPISNTQVYILSKKEELQPIGVIGEICTSGLSLARGYLNQPELTQEKFIANPFKEGERLYRTGDLGRWLSDGNIEFIGRKDNQVKIPGSS
jgi:non-ribosomal peptide synthetase component F